MSVHDDYCVTDPISHLLTVGSTHSVLNVKSLVGAFNQEKVLVGAFSVIVETSPMVRVHIGLLLSSRTEVVYSPQRQSNDRVVEGEVEVLVLADGGDEDEVGDDDEGGEGGVARHPHPLHRPARLRPLLLLRHLACHCTGHWLRLKLEFSLSS